MKLKVKEIIENIYKYVFNSRILVFSINKCKIILHEIRDELP